jgi:hypothetical protein
MTAIARIRIVACALAVALGGTSAGAAAKPGTDFVSEAKLLYRTTTCGNADALPRGVPPEVIDAHCRQLAKAYAEYRTRWLDRAVPYLATLVPHGLPHAVVYPFGGGDLVTALATFPDADDFTTISLEPAGDVRKVDAVTPSQWSEALRTSRGTLGILLAKAYNTSKALRAAHQPLPEEIVHTMAALALFGYEPLALRYFAIERDGSLQYLDADAHGALDTRDMELAFRKAGDPAAPVKVLRHVSANLDDHHLSADPRVLAYLGSKGAVVAMTKAAIHLLGSDDFALLRNYLLEHMRWMISDDTGILPRHARAAGFVQEGHGTYSGASRFGHVSREDEAELRKLFPRDEPLPFFAYGYPDASGKGHLIVTHGGTSLRAAAP